LGATEPFKGPSIHPSKYSSTVCFCESRECPASRVFLFEDRHNCPGNPELNCTVHDEVILSVEAEHAEAAKAWVEKPMANAEREAVMDLESPIAVDVKTKESWGG
jgi:hypothetical protein